MKVEFSKKLYKLVAIKNAVKAFSELADFKIFSEKDVIKVELKNIDKEVEGVICDEFSNYILILMKK